MRTRSTVGGYVGLVLAIAGPTSAAEAQDDEMVEEPSDPQCEPLPQPCLESMVGQDIRMALADEQNETVVGELEMELPKEFDGLTFPERTKQMNERCGDLQDRKCRFRATFPEAEDPKAAFLRAFERRTDDVIAHMRRQYRSYRSDQGVSDTGWEMTPQQVRRKVGDLKRVNRDLWQARIRVAGISTVVGFAFVDNKLAAAIVQLDDTSATAPNQAVEAFAELSSLLSDKYGDATGGVQGADNRVDVLSTEIGGLGRAVRRDSASIEHRWATDESEIVHRLSGADLSFEHQLVYRSKFLSGKLQQQMRSRWAADL